MEISEVPQDNNRMLGGHRKAVYARDASGRMVLVASSGWEVEEIVTSDAVEQLNEQASAARRRVEAGLSSPLECWMYVRRMDLLLLAQSTGLWRWRVRRHLQPAHFVKLSPTLLQRYADALGISVDALLHLP
ncbi:MAG: hypothetical protein JWL63_1190 [Rhodocyclales bacterium]|nr:hypothetical protein [Rhodocyclales bacterium]